MGYLGNGECYLMSARNLATEVRRLVYGASTTFSFFIYLLLVYTVRK